MLEKLIIGSVRCSLSWLSLCPVPWKSNQWLARNPPNPQRKALATQFCEKRQFPQPVNSMCDTKTWLLDTCTCNWERALFNSAAFRSSRPKQWAEALLSGQEHQILLLEGAITQSYRNIRGNFRSLDSFSPLQPYSLSPLPSFRTFPSFP